MQSRKTGMLVVAVTLAAGVSAGQAQGIEVGKYEYRRSCATCHGPAGKGDGPVAASLKRAPADLTRLSQSNFGVFPFARVYDVIDGRFEVATHGKREMPVWGDAFQPDGGSGQFRLPSYDVSKEINESIVRARILALIDYIFTLQIN
jgi:mono/diheme cytochrome c family protein